MTIYRIDIEASNPTGDIWQTMHTETVTTDDTPEELAAFVAGNQTIADGVEGDAWRVRITEEHS